MFGYTLMPRAVLDDLRAELERQRRQVAVIQSAWLKSQAVASRHERVNARLRRRLKAAKALADVPAPTPVVPTLPAPRPLPDAMPFPLRQQVGAWSEPWAREDQFEAMDEARIQAGGDWRRLEDPAGLHEPTPTPATT